MVIPNHAEAVFYLQHLNYYRLGAYWLPFEIDHSSHSFRKGTTFEDVLNLYIFDCQLRLLVLDAIERVEVSVRSTWAYNLAHRHGAHAHLDQSLALRAHWWQQNINKLTEEIGRSDEAFIQHYRHTYSESLPPVWAVCEIMSLGLLSRWYDNLKPMQVRSDIEKQLYNSLVILLHFMDAVDPHHQWRRALKALIAKHGIDVSAMDFPNNWEVLSIWREAQP